MNALPMLNQREHSCPPDFLNKTYLGRTSCLKNKADFVVVSKMLTVINHFNMIKPHFKLIYISLS